MVERGALWLLRHRRPPLEIASVVAEFRPGISELASTLETHVRGKMRAQLFANEAARLAAGIPEMVAQRSVVWPLMHTALDIIDLADRQHLAVRETAAAYWDVFEVLELGWLWDAVGMLPRNDRWQTQARSALRDDLMGALADLADDALYVGGAREWASANERVVSRAMAMFAEIRRADAYDLTTLSVALRQLRNLVLITQRPASN
jgi:glutamate dehydrogenase